MRNQIFHMDGAVGFLFQEIGKFINQLSGLSICFFGAGSFLIAQFQKTENHAELVAVVHHNKRNGVGKALCGNKFEIFHQMVKKAVDIVENKRFYREQTVLHGHTVISQFIKRAHAAGRKNHKIGIQELLFALFQGLCHNHILNLRDDFITLVEVIIFFGGDSLDSRGFALNMFPAV